MSRLSICIVFLLLVFLSIAQASEGDDSPEFQACVEHCVQDECPNKVLPIYLRLTLWSCPDDCRYNCMHEITARNDTVVQYYGKWPFYRFFGIQEPASVLFSMGNLCMHYHYLRIMQREIPDSNMMRPYSLGYAIVNLNTWISSSVFHSRDLPRTEKLDYFGAALTIMYSLYYAVLRVFGLAGTRNAAILGATGIVLYFCHICYMALVSFDYVYNMVACGVVAVIQGSLWVLWYIMYRRQLPYAKWVLWSTIANAMAAALEIFDFPPLWLVFDAHSLWHFSTIFVAPLWYWFVLEDAKHTDGYSILPSEQHAISV